jgi:hypothetical protein
VFFKLLVDYLLGDMYLGGVGVKDDFKNKKERF